MKSFIKSFGTAKEHGQVIYWYASKNRFIVLNTLMNRDGIDFVLDSNSEVIASFR